MCDTRQHLHWAQRAWKSWPDVTQPVTPMVSARRGSALRAVTGIGSSSGPLSSCAHSLH